MKETKSSKAENPAGGNHMKRFFTFLAFVTTLTLIVGCGSVRPHTETTQAPITPPKSPEKASYLIYTNEKLGFSLQLPASWDGWYYIDENDNFVEIGFLGKSKSSRLIDPISGKLYMCLFSVGDEEIAQSPFIDLGKQIGVSRGMKFYYFTPTDAPLTVMYDFYTDPNQKDEEEKKLAYEDHLKVTQMQKEIPEILKTFKALD